MPRIARVIAANYPHHVTQRGNNRADVFFDDEDRRYYIQTLKRYCQQYKVRIWAYCLMSNHVHMLVVPKTDTSLAGCIGRTNLVYTQHVNKKYKRSGRLWQNRFFSTVVEEDAYLWAVVRYIECNPVKANLTTECEKYIWSSCRANSLGESDELVEQGSWLAASERREYQRFLRQRDTETEERIRRATSTGRPLGGDGFIKKLEMRLLRRLLPGKAGRPKKT